MAVGQMLFWLFAPWLWGLYEAKRPECLLLLAYLASLPSFHQLVCWFWSCSFAEHCSEVFWFLVMDIRKSLLSVEVSFEREPEKVLFMGCLFIGVFSCLVRVIGLTLLTKTWQMHGEFCWLKAVDTTNMVWNPAFNVYEIFVGPAAGSYGSQLSRAQYLRITKHNPSRLYLLGMIAIVEGGLYIKPDKFDRKAHIRLYSGASTIDDSENIHVDAVRMVETAANANAATIGLTSANEQFKAVLGSTFRLPFNMALKTQEALKKMVPFPFTFSGGSTNTSDHQVLAGARHLLRDCFERMYKVVDSKVPTLVIGSTSNDLAVYEASPNVDHYFHLKEGKDYGRTVVDLLTKFSHKLTANFGRSKNALNGNDGSRYRQVYNSIKAILDDYKRVSKLPNSFLTDKTEVKKQYERIVLRDIYELTAKDMEDWFLRTGANQAIGYGIYPDELVFDNVAPDAHYKYNYNPVTDIASITYNKGYSNGYAHKKSTWAWWLRNPVTVCAHFNMVAEVTCRIGPYAIYTITRTSAQSEYVPRTLSLPEHKWRALVLDVVKAFKAGKVEDDMRFAVNVNEWAAVTNWALSLNENSMTYSNIVLYLRRMSTGVSLVNKELTEAWQIKPLDIPKLALAVLVYCSRERKVADEAFSGAIEPAAVNFARNLYRRPVSLLDNLLSYVSRNGFSNEIVTFPDNELTTLDQTPLIRSREVDTRYKVDVTTQHSLKVDCPFCEHLAGRLGAQVMHCHNAEKSGVVDTSMTDDEVKTVLVGLIDDDKDAAGLAALKQKVKKIMPPGGFKSNTKFSYILGGPGAGKSYIIKLLCRDEDAVYAPFTKLKVDYQMVPDPETGRRRDLRFATTHRGLMLGMVKTLYIDEFTALDWAYIRLVINNSCPDEVVIVGDTKQTGVRSGTVEGTHICDAIQIDDLPRHELKMNFRNGWDTVHWLNKVGLYGFGTLKTQDEHFDPTIRSIEVLKGGAKNQAPSGSAAEVRPRTPYTHVDGFEQIFFTHNVAMQYGFSQDTDKYTVRSYQGSTVERVELYLTEADLCVAAAHGMMIVAMSRAKVLTRVITDGSTAVDAFLESWHLPTSGHYDADWNDIPAPKSNSISAEEAPGEEAWFFAQRARTDESFNTFSADNTRRYSISSYQALVAVAIAVSFYSPLVANSLMLCAASGASFSRRGLFTVVPAFSKLTTIAWVWRLALTVLFVLVPSWLPVSIQPVENTIIFEAVLGPSVGHYVSQELDSLMRYSVGGIAMLSKTLPPFWRFVTVGCLSLAEAPLLSVLLGTPNPVDLAYSRLVTLGFALYNLYVYRGARTVLCFEARPDNTYNTFVSGYSFWSSTITISTGGRILLGPRTMMRGLSTTSKELSARFYLASGRWLADPGRSLFGWKDDLDHSIDIELGIQDYPEGTMTSCQDAFQMAFEHTTSDMTSDVAIPLNGAESVLVPGEITNGTMNVADASIPLTSKANVEGTVGTYAFTSGYGYTFSKTNVWQSVKAIATRYANKKKAVKPVDNEGELLVEKIVNTAFTELFDQEKLGFDDELMERAIAEAMDTADKKGYDSQIKDIDTPDATTIRMVMKATFKAGPFSNLKPFDPNKAGMGVSPFDKHAHVVFATGMRYLNMVVLKALKDFVVYDNRLSPEQVQVALNEALMGVPEIGAVNGITDFKQYDSQQDAFTQALFKAVAERLGAGPEFMEHYLRFCKNGKVLASGSMKVRLGHEKLSGDPATLLSNTMIGMVILNYVFRGTGPMAVAVKGDDGFKRQVGLAIDHDRVTELSRHTRMEIMMGIEDPAEFCGKIVSNLMVEHIPRQLTQIISKRYKSYAHFMMAMESVRDWCRRIEKLPPILRREVICINALLLRDGVELPGVGYVAQDFSSPEHCERAVNTIEGMFDTIKSFTHISFEDFMAWTKYVVEPRIVPASDPDRPGCPIPTL